MLFRSDCLSDLITRDVLNWDLITQGWLTRMTWMSIMTGMTVITRATFKNKKAERDKKGCKKKCHSIADIFF